MQPYTKIVEDEDEDPKYFERESDFNSTDRVLLTAAFNLYYN